MTTNAARVVTALRAWGSAAATACDNYALRMHLPRETADGVVCTNHWKGHLAWPCPVVVGIAKRRDTAGDPS